MRIVYRHYNGYVRGASLRSASVHTVRNSISQSSAWKRLTFLKCSHLAVLGAVSHTPHFILVGKSYNRAMTMHTVKPYQIHDSA
jgi:hypothetical protein